MKTTRENGIVTVSREFDGRMISAQGATLWQATDRLIDRIALMTKIAGQNRDRVLRENRRPGSMVDTHV